MSMYPTKDEIQNNLNNALRDMSTSVATLVANCGVIKNQIDSLHELDEYDIVELVLFRDKVLELQWRLDRLRINYEK